MIYDEQDRLQSRQDATDAALSRQGSSAGEGSLVVVGKTATKTTYPTSAGRFFWVIPQAVTGTETEGGAGTTTDEGDGFYALNLGGTIPPSGTVVVCIDVNYRMVFRYG